MPIVNGIVVRSRFTSLKLDEISSVDNPAQPGALASIVKRADPHRTVLAEVAKYVCEDDGAHLFSEVLAENKFSQEVWPCVDALSQSIRSIVGDSALTGGERDAKINQSVEEFRLAVSAISPEVSKQLEPLLLRKRENPMPKSAEELQTELTKATGQVTDLTGKLEAAEKALTSATEAKDKAEADCTTAKDALEASKAEGGELATVKAELVTTKAALVAATEEVIKVGETEIKKSVVGPEQFAMAKALADERDDAKIEKRVEAEFRHVVGTATEKAAVLKLAQSLPTDAPARKALEAILTSAEKMVAQGFDRLGGGGGATPTQKAAQKTFTDKVAEIEKRDSCTHTAAMSKARSEFPDEFAAAYPDSETAEQPAS